MSNTLSSDIIQPVFRAISDGNLNEFKRLIALHPVMKSYSSASTPSLLHESARKSQMAFVRFFLESGFDIDLTTEAYPTDSPLDYAIGDATPEMIDFLLSRGADTTIGRPLIGAINREPEELGLELVKLLVKHGADVNRQYPIFGDENFTMTALDFASGKPTILEYLLANGATAVGKQPEEDQFDSSAEIVEHFDSHFGRVSKKSLGEIVSTVEPAIRIHVIPATSKRPHVTLFTTGMSDKPMNVPEEGEDYQYAELFIQLPGKWPITRDALKDDKNFWPFRWLRSIAEYPHVNDTWLGGPTTIIANDEPPQPLGPGVNFTCILLMVEQQCAVSDGRTIQLYRMIPIYTNERDLERTQDLPALMRAFDRQSVSPVVDPNRKSSVS